jgi:hypothetical protein
MTYYSKKAIRAREMHCILDDMKQSTKAEENTTCIVFGNLGQDPLDPALGVAGLPFWLHAPTLELNINQEQPYQTNSVTMLPRRLSRLGSS